MPQATQKVGPASKLVHQLCYLVSQFVQKNLFLHLYSSTRC